MKRLIMVLAAASLVAGCSVFEGGSKRPTTPTVGQRIAVLSSDAGVEVDPGLADLPVTVPAPYVNTEWGQSGGNAAKSMGHVALPDALTQAWSVSIGSGSSRRARLVSEPAVGGGRVYTIDTQANVRAFDERNGGLVWNTQIRGEGVGSDVLFGGGVAYQDGRVYGTNGAGQAYALDAATGAIVWNVQPGGPLRGSPTIAAGNVYVVSQDNQLYALNATNGETLWTGTGSFELANVFGAASPAFAQSTVVAGFSSGELTAFRYENGQVVWVDALARTGISTVVGTLSDIDADPVIDNGRVFSIGQGGRMVAVELITGQRAWELNAAGISTPWVAGEWVYVVTDRAQLLAVARASGRIRWMAQLPRYTDPDDRKGPIFWRGPVLAGNRLVLTGSNGQIAFVNPSDGSVQHSIPHRTPISLSPVVANNTLFVLDNDGRLTAWR